MVVIQPTNTWHHYLQTGSVSQIRARYIVDFLNVLCDDTHVFKWFLFVFNGI